MEEVLCSRLKTFQYLKGANNVNINVLQSFLSAFVSAHINIIVTFITENIERYRDSLF